MSILVLTSPWPAEPYVEAIRRIAPELTVLHKHEECVPETVEAILAWRLQDGIVSAYPNLRLLGSAAAGVEKILAISDLPHHIPVVRTVDPFQQTEIAQYVVGATLRFTRDFALYENQQRERKWIRHPVRPPEHSRIGIMGLGGVGQTLVRAFRELGYPVSGWSRSAKDLPGIPTYAGMDQLAGFLQESNVLVCALPLTAETKGIINRATLARLPQGAFVINVGRGGHLIEADLLEALEYGGLAGAMLDVFEREPLPEDSPIWAHPDIFITPHIAAQSAEAVVAAQFVENLFRVRAGLPLMYQVDRMAGY